MSAHNTGTMDKQQVMRNGAALTDCNPRVKYNARANSFAPTALHFPLPGEDMSLIFIPRNNPRPGCREKSGSAVSRARTRKGAVSTRTTPDTIFGYSELFQRLFETGDKRCDRARESARRRRVRWRISETSAENNFRERKRPAASSC